MLSLNKIASLLIICIVLIITLIYGQSLMVPFVFALLLWTFVRGLKNLLDKVRFIRNNFPSWIKSLIISLLIVVILGLVSTVLTSSINTLAKSYGKYESNLEAITQQINTMMDIDLEGWIRNHASDFDFGGILSAIFSSLTELLGNAFMILLYALFIFLEETNFNKKLRLVFTESENYEMVNETLDKIERSVAQYLGLKTLVSLITGVLSFFTLMIIGIDSPAFWAFLIFLLNYIPTIGSLIATLFPAIFCLLQFGEFTPAIMVLIFVGAIQVLVGNLIEPRIMGNSLNISPLAAIIALSFWGAIWGITGMIMSVPITVIAVIIFSQFQQTRSFAIMLSEKGRVNKPD